jgi:hypothetical protein
MDGGNDKNSNKLLLLLDFMRFSKYNLNIIISNRAFAMLIQGKNEQCCFLVDEYWQSTNSYKRIF